jgi:hypothetical protein
MLFTDQQPFSATAAIPAATPTVVDVELGGSTNWTIVLRNTGANPVTALTISVSPLGVSFEVPASITTGIPLAAATALPAIVGSNEPASVARLTITSTLGTTVSVEGLGK